MKKRHEKSWLAAASLVVAMGTALPAFGADLADETGLYRAERGLAEIPLRFAEDDEKGAFFRPWCVKVRERASGLEGTAHFCYDTSQ